MSNAAKSMFVFGIYLACVGSILVFVPNLAFIIFGLPDTGGVWIRVAGMLLLFLAFFAIQTARKEMVDYFRLTVYTRSIVPLFFLAFVLLHLANPILLVFGIIDLSAAIWTSRALRSSQPAHRAPITTIVR